MPILGRSDDIDYRGRSQIASGTPTAKEHDFADVYSTGLERSPGSATLAFAAGIPLDLVDTVSSSLGLTERQEINQKFISAIGSPGLTGFYEENKGAMEVGSGIAGVILSDYLAGKVLKPAGYAMKAIRGVPYANKIAGLDRQYEAARRLAQLSQREVAMRGLMGQDRFIGANMTFNYMGNMTVNRAAATKNFFGAAVRKGLARNLATEGVMAATLNENSFLYSDDLAHNMMWSAAGLGIGAGFDSLVSSYALRKMANSEQIRQLNRKAYDVTGFENDRLTAFEGAITGDGFLFRGGGGVTDKVSALATQSAELNLQRGADERSLTLFGQRAKLATPLLDQAHEEMQKVTIRGFQGVSGSGQAVGNMPLIKESLLRDPMSMYGVEEIAQPGREGITQTFTLRSEALTRKLDEVQEAIRDGGKKTTKTVKGEKVEVIKPWTPEELDLLREQQQALIFKNSHTPVVMFTPGEWAPLSHAAAVEKFEPRKVIREGGLGKDGRAIWSVKRSEDFKSRLGIGDDLQVYLPDGKSRMEQLETHEMIHMFHVGKTMVEHFAQTRTTMVLPENPSWFQLDLAEQLVKDTGDASLVQYSGTLTRETAAIESFAQKVDAVLAMKKIAALTKTPADSSLAFKVKLALNLPRIDSYTSSLMNFSDQPIDLLLAGFKSGDEVRNAGHMTVLKAINDARKIMGLTDETVDSVKSLHGESFTFLRQHNGEPTAPVLAMRRPLTPYQWTRDDLLVRQAMKQGNLRQELMGEAADPYSRALAEVLSNDPTFSLSRAVQDLADDQHRSSVPGFTDAAPQSTRGALINAFTFRSRRDVDSPVMLAQSRQQELKTRVAQAAVKEIFERNMGESISIITSNRNARSLMLLNQFGSFRGGWQLAKKPVETTLPSGEKGFQFVLDEKSVLNQRRFKQLHGRELVKGQALLSPEGRSIVLDELSMDVLARMQLVHKETLAAKNTALRSQGLPQIDEQAWYWPPPNLKGKYVGFTRDLDGKVVPGMSVVADSPEQLAAKSAELMKSDQWQEGFRFNTRDEITRFASLWDKAQMDFIDPSINTAIQPNKHGGGKLLGNTLNEASFADALVTMRDSLIAHSDDVLEILHDDVIKSLKARSAIAKVESAVGKQQAQHGSIYDRALQNLLGHNALSAKDSFFGDITGSLEDRIDGLLKGTGGAVSGAAKKNKVLNVFNDWIRAAVPGKSPKGSKFDQFAKELGQYMPYKTVSEMIESQTAATPDPDIKSIASKLSWFEASSRLRWLESAHALINFGSILSNTPAVIRNLQLRTGETVAEAAARNASTAMPMTLPNGKTIVVPNVYKLMWTGMRDTWRNTGDKVIEAAKEQAFRLGFMDQEVAEFNAAWGAIDSKAGWRKVMFGDPNHRGNGLGDRFVRKGGIDRALSLASDKSEQMTRQWGMQMGYRVGREMGIDDPHQLNMFAHEITNKLIANYDPRNRPEIFQGALGSMAGLFQSYVFNFYGRLFRYLETTPDKGSIAAHLNPFQKGGAHPAAVQMAMQSAMFGVGSVPGWNALNATFFDRGQSKGEDPVESIYARFGQIDGDMIMHGTLSNLPKMFGMDGVNLYTRGDANVRLPGTEWQVAETPVGQLPMPNIPVVDTISRVGKGLAAGFGALFDENPGIGLNHLAEIASNAITNRPIAGLIEQAGAHGYDTSWDGQLVAETKTASEMLYRVLGVRSMAQQKSIDQFYLGKAAQEEQESRKDQLRGLTRAAIRDKRYDEVPQLFEQFVANGGDPRYYTRWVKDSFESALETRSERALDKALKDPTNRSNAQIGRLLDGQIDVDEAEQNPDDYGREEEMQRLIDEGLSTIPNAVGDPSGDRFPTDDQLTESENRW